MSDSCVAEIYVMRLLSVSGTRPIYLECQKNNVFPLILLSCLSQVCPVAYCKDWVTANQIKDTTICYF